MGRPRKDRPTKEELERLYKELGTMKAVAERLGEDRRTIRKLIEKYDISRIKWIKPKKARPTKEQLEKLYERLWTIAAVAKELNFNEEEIGKLFKKYEIKRLPKQTSSNKLKISKNELEILYKEHKDFKKIAKIVGVSYSTIRRLAKKHNVKYDPFNRKISTEELSSLYNEYGSLFAVADKLGISHPYISKLFKTYFVEHNSTTRKYIYDENFFNNLDNPAVWYLTGFLTADGSITGGGQRVKLGLAIKDLELLEKFQKTINSSPPLPISFSSYSSEQYNKTYYLCNIELCSIKVVKSLEKFNIMAGKTYNLKFPLWIAESPHLNVYMRGFVDGDGGFGIYENSQAFYICGTYDFVYNFNKILVEKAELPSKYYKKVIGKYTNANCYRMLYSSTKIIKQIINWLYQDLQHNPDALYLDRKFKIIRPYLDFELCQPRV